MKKKTYEAESVNQAMLKVKMDMGEDAVIVETREVQKGGIFGFFGESVVEVEACKSESKSASNGQSGLSSNSRSNGVSNRSDQKRTAVDRSGSEPSRDMSVQDDSKKQSSNGSGDRGFDREIDEPAVPDFSPREHAEKLIDQKQDSGTNSSEKTYSRPTPQRSSNADRDTNSLRGERNVDNDESGPSTERIDQLVENTSVLTDKIEDLATSIETDEGQQDDSAANFPGELNRVYRELLRNGVDKKFARELTSRAKRDLEPDEVEDYEEIVERVKQKIESDIQTPKPIQPEKNDTIIVPLIGPTGVGKTTTLAKLAAYFSVQESCSVGFITFDTYRLAAVEQLKTYAEILQVPIEDVKSKQEFKSSLESMSCDRDIIFVDTAGRSQFDKDKLNELDSMLSDEFPTVRHLVVDCSNRMDDIDDILEGFQDVGYDRLIVTKLDETNYHGAVFNLIRRTDKPIAYFTNGQDVPDDLEMLDPDQIADLVLDVQEEGMEDI